MNAGRYDAELIRIGVGVGAAVTGKLQEVIEANPFREATRRPPTEEERKKESRRAVRMMVRGLKTMVQHGG